jgi:hypothetical protein
MRVLLNKTSGKVTTSAHTFSDQNWGVITKKLLDAAARQTSMQLWGIMELVKFHAHETC